jgi:superfamily II DNA or RNA helicase
MKFRYDDKLKKLIVTESTRIEYYQIQIWLNRYVKNYKFTPAFKRGVWDGKIDFFNNGSIDIGLWRECLKACQTIGTTFTIENKADFPLNRNLKLEDVQKFCDEFFKDHVFKDKDGNLKKFKPHDYQVETAFSILKNRYCIAEVATSGGKTVIMAIVIFYTWKHINSDAKFLIVTPAISLTTQTTEAIVGFNTGDNNSNKEPLDIRCEEIYSEKPRKFTKKDEANLYVGCYQSLVKYPKKFFEQFYGIMVDESHVAVVAINSILEKTIQTSYLRAGVSGTFPDEESCEILGIQKYMGPKIASVSARTLIDSGKIADLKVKAIILNHQDLEFNKTLNSINSHEAGRQKYEIEKKYLHASEKRLKFIKKLVEKCTKNTLILFNNIEYGVKIMQELDNIDGKKILYIDGNISSKFRDEIKKDMETDEHGIVKILVASYGTLGTGVSINAIFNVILAESFKSESRIIQAIGRSLRLHADKQLAIIFDLVDIYWHENIKNVWNKHFIERQLMYKKHKYPLDIIKCNL